MNKWTKLDNELKSMEGLKSWKDFLCNENIADLDKMIAIKQLRSRLKDIGADTVEKEIKILLMAAGA